MKTAKQYIADTTNELIKTEHTPLRRATRIARIAFATACIRYPEVLDVKFNTRTVAKQEKWNNQAC